MHFLFSSRASSVSWTEVALIFLLLFFPCLITLFCEGVAHIDGWSIPFVPQTSVSYAFQFSSLYLILYMILLRTSQIGTCSSAVYYVLLRLILIIQIQTTNILLSPRGFPEQCSVQTLPILYMTSILSKHSPKA